MPRFFVPGALVAEQSLALPASAARHVQVLRLQPGQEITLFNGEGGQWQARITAMGRSDVQVELLQWQATEREPQRRVHLGLGMPANERMDWLVEKATELGVARIQPLHEVEAAVEARVRAEFAHRIAELEQARREAVAGQHTAQQLYERRAGAAKEAEARASAERLFNRCATKEIGKHDSRECWRQCQGET
jgi:16S rRNA (uracil1498-N3)-methyltransferase